MYAKPSWRRATGELAIDPALHQLVMHTGALLDRLIRSRGVPIPEAPPAPARGDPAGTPAASAAPGGEPKREPL
jgi:hypothetical protein